MAKQIAGQMTLDLFIEPQQEQVAAAPEEKREKPTPELEEFSDYVGKCEYCMWYGYGLYSTFTGERKKGTEQYNCQWEMKNGTLEPWCTEKSFWKPSCKKIPRLCGNCDHSNSFHYQCKPQYKEHSFEAIHDPVEEPNIYCTREDGSVNRRYVFQKFWANNFGARKWDRQHEWDTCDAWRSDRETLR